MAKAMPMPIVLFHHDPDGICAAYAAHKGLKGMAEFRGLSADEPLPLPDLLDRDVHVLDLSFTAERFAELCEVARTVRIIDHHTSGQPVYEGWPDHCTYDSQHSTCVLAWGHYCPGAELPRAFEYVEDRDLWRWQLPWSREINLALNGWLRVDNGGTPCFAAVEAAIHSLGQLQSEGQAMYKYVTQQVEDLVAQAVIQNLFGFDVPVVNVAAGPRGPLGEVGERLLQVYPQAPFAAMFRVDADGSLVWSLRSCGDVDVGLMAKACGGGGHVAAAGFRSPPPEPGPWWPGVSAAAAFDPLAPGPSVPPGGGAQNETPNNPDGAAPLPSGDQGSDAASADIGATVEPPVAAPAASDLNTPKSRAPAADGPTKHSHKRR
jgi:oligoribonuclease NrnB/cAMP/cGMP phosphodiesterase (DHH superfamily)